MSQSHSDADRKLMYADFEAAYNDADREKHCGDSRAIGLVCYYGSGPTHCFMMIFKMEDE